MTESIITDLDIQVAFLGTNFGRVDHRKLLEASVFKKAVGYHCGHTITEIMHKLGLIAKSGLPNKKGRRFLAEAFGHLMQASG